MLLPVVDVILVWTYACANTIRPWTDVTITAQTASVISEVRANDLKNVRTISPPISWKFDLPRKNITQMQEAGQQKTGAMALCTELENKPGCVNASMAFPTTHASDA